MQSPERKNPRRRSDDNLAPRMTSSGAVQVKVLTRRASGPVGQDERMAFQIAGTPDADAVLDEYPFALVLGMMLDQQYGMEHAFRGGWKLLSRFGTLDPGAIAAADPDEFKELC